MKKYAKIIDEQTKEVEIGVGVNDEYYIEIGMKKMDVEQAYNGNWYVKGYTPEEPEEDKKLKVRLIKNSYLDLSDYTQLPDSPFTSEEKFEYAQYREYLRNYTKKDEWWLENPLTFEEWKESN